MSIRGGETCCADDEDVRFEMRYRPLKMAWMWFRGGEVGLIYRIDHIIWCQDDALFLAAKRSLEQLQERQRLLWQKRHWKNNQFNTSDGRYCLNVSMLSQGYAKAKWTWNDDVWSSVVMDDWMMGDVWCGAPLALTYVLRRKKITQWKQGVLTYTYGSTSTIRGTINSTFAC